MSCSLKIRLVLVLTATLLAACSGEVEDTRPGQPVKTRQAAFKEFIKSFEPMGVMLRNKRYDADKFLALATELHAQRNAPWTHFGPETNYPPTKATPEVWKQPADFEREQKAFLAATETLLSAAQSKDEKQAASAHKALYERCQSCHKTYKTR